MSQHIKKEDALGLEVKHVTYVKAQDGSNHDMLVAKCNVHMKDGRRIPILRYHEDYKRPFWVTQKGRQTHRDKRDYEFAKNCRKYSTTQVEMPRAIARVLGDFSAGPNPPLRRLARSPYLYGSDVSSVCLLRNDYKTRWPDLRSANIVAGGDIETNVHSKDGEIICMSVTCKERAKLFYLRSWVADIPDLVENTHKMAERYIGQTMRERNITLEVEVYDTPAQIVVASAETLHAWKPDFYTFWNMDFDVSKMIVALEKEGVDPAQVFSDPSVPDQYKYFDYRRGPAQKVTASGKTMSINIEDRWNWVAHPASFQFIDSLPVYRILRIAAGKDSSYKLDYILDKEFDGKLSKLRIKETEHLSGLRWHEVMQEHYKLEYAIYNVFDSITLELLDEKTKDLELSISSFSKNSDYKNFNSNPKRLCDDMHFWYLRREEPCVIGSSSDDPVDELDADVISHDDWMNLVE